MPSKKLPYLSLGKHLRSVRVEAKKSLTEVSGAIEVDEKHLEQIEAGYRRPDEELMLLIISYFNLADQEALHMWDLANYDSKLADHIEINRVDINDSSTKQNSRPLLMLLPVDVRTIYSDGVEITWNESGMCFNFTQSVNGDSKQQGVMPIAKIGMSYNQAEKVYKCLGDALLRAKYSPKNKQIPPGKKQDNL